jgi:hypothetical protein
MKDRASAVHSPARFAVFESDKSASLLMVFPGHGECSHKLEPRQRQGALVTIDDVNARVRVLPLR